ncbi:MAG TPA: HIT domain-containing protein [Frankiaceae bacterium]|jgi:histidine triad (HIT) family protein|nr:HIT domain-containing protein [Frankiaceae bacterium]
MPDDCVFCRLVAGEIPATIVRETGDTVAFRDIAPKAPVHVLVVPRTHHANVADLAAADPALTATLVAEAAEVARAEGIGDGWRLVLNTGASVGQTVFHVHAHVLGGGTIEGL